MFGGLSPEKTDHKFSKNSAGVDGGRAEDQAGADLGARPPIGDASGMFLLLFCFYINTN